jgi:predicted extracellular nuclease
MKLRTGRYWRTSSTVRAWQGNPDPPAVAGLYEIENRKVLEDLIYSTGLAKFEYSVIHEDSPDERGIDVCLIYRRDLVEILDYNYISPADSSGKPFRTRSVLYVKFRSGDDTIHLFLNHWPSRRGGVLNGEAQRGKIALLLKSKADSLASADSRAARIIFAGDFNATPDDEIIGSLSAGYGSGIKMLNLSDRLPAGKGTYKYRGTWEMIDQVFVSESLAGRTNELSVFSCTLTIFSPEFLLHDDPVFPGLTPFSTFRGYRYQAGFSDHLPVLLDLKVRKDF